MKTVLRLISREESNPSEILKVVEKEIKIAKCLL